MTTVRSRLVGAAALAVLGIAGVPGTAVAHTPYASDECDGLTVSMYSYSSPGTPNHLTVVIDGATVADTAFGESFHQFFAWSPAATHNWSVIVDGLTDDGDATLTGIQVACATGSSPTTAAPTTEPSTTDTSTTDTSTTLVESDGPTTTTTTTTEVDSGGPTLPATTSLSGGGGGLLPATGGDLVTTRVAAILAALGAVLTIGAVRRRAA